MVGRLDIGLRPVGEGCPTFIIAEAGVNHNGDIDLARRLIEAAKLVEADAVKFQTWKTEKLVVEGTRMADYQVENTGESQSQYDMLKKLELSYEQFGELKSYADELGIMFLSTPDEEESADFLADLQVPVFKVGSGEVTNEPFLRYIARKGSPIILSTGMASIGEVEAAVCAIEEEGNSKLALLHCVSDYPAEPRYCNLKAMDTLRSTFGYPVGFSDHTLGMSVAIAAVAREACILEKHLTLDKELPGPDHRLSMSPNEFTDMVRAVRSIEKALGDGRKRPTAVELETKKVVQKTIVAARDLYSGEILTDKDLVLRRSSDGLPSHFLPTVLGRKVRSNISANQNITFEILE